MEQNQIVERLRRNRVAKKPYTPSKPEGTTKPVPYKLDEEKALRKKVDNASRQQGAVSVDDKHGTVVISNLTSAAYELLKDNFYQYYKNSSDKTYSLISETSKGKKSNSKLAVNQAICVKKKTGGRQLFRLNFQNTTNTITLNGKYYETCLQEDFPNILETLKNETLLQDLNNKIKETCSNLLGYDQINDSKTPGSRAPLARITNPTQTTHSLLDDSIMMDDRMPGEEEPDLDCPVCLQSTTDTVEPSEPCGACERWYHTKCMDHDNTNSIFICNLCTMMSDSLDKGDVPINHDTNPTQKEDSDSESEETLISRREPRAQGTDCETPPGARLPAMPSTRNANYYAQEHEPSQTPDQDDKLLMSHKGYGAGSPGGVSEIPPVELSRDLLETKDEDPNAHTSPLMQTGKQPTHQDNNLLNAIINKEQDNNLSNKTKTRKPRTPKITNSDPQLAECKARILMLETENRDYKESLNMLRQRFSQQDRIQNINDDYQSQYTTDMRSKPNPEGTQNFQQIIDNQKEILHKLQIQDIQAQHRLENQNLHIQLQTMQLQRDILAAQQAFPYGYSQPNLTLFHHSVPQPYFPTVFGQPIPQPHLSVQGFIPPHVPIQATYLPSTHTRMQPHHINFFHPTHHHPLHPSQNAARPPVLSMPTQVLQQHPTPQQPFQGPLNPAPSTQQRAYREAQHQERNAEPMEPIPNKQGSIPEVILISPPPLSRCGTRATPDTRMQNDSISKTIRADSASVSEVVLSSVQEPHSPSADCEASPETRAPVLPLTKNNNENEKVTLVEDTENQSFLGKGRASERMDRKSPSQRRRT